MSLRSEDGTQHNLLALFIASKLMMSYVLDSINQFPLWESRFWISKCRTLTFAAMSTLTPGPMSRVTGIWSAWTRLDCAPKKRFNKIRLEILVMIEIPTLHLPFEKWAGASRWVPLGKKIWTLSPSKVGNISKFATKKREPLNKFQNSVNHWVPLGKKIWPLSTKKPNPPMFWLWEVPALIPETTITLANTITEHLEALTWVAVSQFQRVTFVRAKGTLEGQVMADSPIAWVRSTTLSEGESEAHWTCNPDNFCEIGANVFYITHSSVTCTKNNQCGDRRFEVHCYLKHAIQTLGLSVPFLERSSQCENCCKLSQRDVAVVLLLTFALERIISSQMVWLFWFLVLYLHIRPDNIAQVELRMVVSLSRRQPKKMEG